MDALNNDQNTPFFDANSGLDFSGKSIRSKSAQRMRYEAQVEVLRRKIGDLEAVREQLGLSQRKICQLLMVDPSAWTRWTRPGESAPPHIYRALQWYLALEDKYPALDVNFWLQSVSRPAEEATEARTAKAVLRIEDRLKASEDRLVRSEEFLTANRARVEQSEERLAQSLDQVSQGLERLTGRLDDLERRQRRGQLGLLVLTAALFGVLAALVL